MAINSQRSNTVQIIGAILSITGIVLVMTDFTRLTESTMVVGVICMLVGAALYRQK
jgi:uncharacterized membrane protein HdeD (DUF308 family)